MQNPVFFLRKLNLSGGIFETHGHTCVTVYTNICECSPPPSGCHTGFDKRVQTKGFKLKKKKHFQNYNFHCLLWKKVFCIKYNTLGLGPVVLEIPHGF